VWDLWPSFDNRPWCFGVEHGPYLAGDSDDILSVFVDELKGQKIVSLTEPKGKVKQKILSEKIMVAAT
jgi:hypothetical protein